MGMIGNLFRVTQEDLQEILDNSSILEDRIYSEESDFDEDLLDIDKAWEAIYYLLTGHPIAEIEEAQPPLSWVLLSGQIVDEEQDLGYGPAFYITAEQVKQLNVELDKISADALKKKYDGKKLAEANVYPEIWEESDALEYILEYFQPLKDFYKTAEAKNMAVITFIN